jgi:hypothetical protein
MPYVIVAGMEPGPKPRTMARIFQARLLQSNTKQRIYVPSGDSSLAAILVTPGGGSTYDVNPASGRALAGIGKGPYSDLAEISRAVEAYTDETCRIIVSPDSYGMRRSERSGHRREFASQGEISFDLVMTDDMAFVEGSYRLDGGAWEVFTFRHAREMERPRILNDVVWPSGVAGINVVVANDIQLNKSFVLKTMTDSFGIAEWIEVRGPDSMQLR